MRLARRRALVTVAAAGLAGFGTLASAAVAEPDPERDVAFAFTDPAIHESSGLVARDGLVVTVNDSGDGNRIFTVDPATGDTVGTTTWAGDARDIEALAPAGAGEVWVGDIGDNAALRDTVQVSRVPFQRGDADADAVTHELVYPDGAHDAETLLAHPQTGQLFVVVKEFRGRVYAAPEDLGDGVNELVRGDDVLGLATDGAFFPDGRHLVLRNYGQAAVYTWPDLDRIAMLTLPAQQQGEGIAVSGRGEVLISSEGAHSEVLRVELPADVRAQIGAPAADSSDSDGPDESGGVDESDVGTPSASPQPGESSSETVPIEAAEERSWWPWALGGIAGVVIIAVLVRSLRPR